MMNIIVLAGEVVGEYSRQLEPWKLTFTLKVARPNTIGEYDYFQVESDNQNLMSEFVESVSNFEREDFVTVTGRLKLTERDGGGYDVVVQATDIDLTGVDKVSAIYSKAGMRLSREQVEYMDRYDPLPPF